MPTPGQLMRLDEIAKHLGLSKTWGDVGFEDQAIAACLEQAGSILRKEHLRSGEGIVAGLATHFGVHFEEVRGPADIDRLEHKYLRQKKEIGFAQLRDELCDPSVDALLFQRTRASTQDSDKWIAVLNLQHTEARVFWDRGHEITHRIAEPAQKLLPFRRHKAERISPVERLIDRITGELAFYPPAFRPLVKSATTNSHLTFEIVKKIQGTYAPTSSLIAAANAVVRNWPRPAIALTASVKGRKRFPEKDRALRVAPQARNRAACESGLMVFPNMRPPKTSPIHRGFIEGRSRDGQEDLGLWTTSDGGSLQRMNVYTSAITLDNILYAVISA